MKQKIRRCGWSSDALLNAYHDKEWGLPLHDDRKQFEFLTLEGMQAGLNWLTILKKRENFRKAFDNFDPKKIAKYNNNKFQQLMRNAGIIRNRLKVSAAIGNAKAFLATQDEMGSFDDYMWGFVGGEQMVNKWRSLKQIPARTKESDNMSKDLLKRGFRFVGSTICYSHMQATGMVNDHVVSCFRYKECME